MKEKARRAHCVLRVLSTHRDHEDQRNTSVVTVLDLVCSVERALPPSTLRIRFTRSKYVASVLLLILTDVTFAFQAWVGPHWQDTTLRTLGLVVQLGHPAFEPCSRPVPANTLMAVVHMNGIHSVNIKYCGCTSQAVSHRQQLMRYRLYPATVRKPKTCITFTAMEALHIQNVQSKCGIYDMYTSLERLTDNTGLVPVRVRLALRSNAF